MKSWRNKQRIVGVALVLALLGTMVLGSASGLAMGSVELLKNGNFESGFRNVPGCGMVGNIGAASPTAARLTTASTTTNGRRLSRMAKAAS